MLQNFKNNQKKTPGEIKNGDSSLTQQIVRNAFLSRNHSDLLKTREVLGALLLDRVMTKEKQLEWYFNIVEFGPHLYGIESASQKYFHISPQQLSTPQCIALVAILPSS
jgi:monofunctional biosynthetic peptidoglycan transglycosylase